MRLNYVSNASGLLDTLAFAPNGETRATGCDNGLARLWRAAPFSATDWIPKSS